MASLIKAARISGDRVSLPAAPSAPSTAQVGTDPVPPVSRQPALEVVDAVRPQRVPADAMPVQPPAQDEAAVRAERTMREAADMKAQLDASLTEAERLRETAEAEGYAEGLARGVEAGQRKGAEAWSDGVAALAAMVQAGQESVTELLDQAEELIASIVFEAVCKIVGDQLITAEGCVAVVRQVLDKVERDELVTLRVSPEDARRLMDAADRAPDAAWAAELRKLAMEHDPGVTIGGCILALKGGTIDGRIETQFRNFAQSLKDAARNA